eukprot:358391-Chlamydomonas_euryale.AAC.3
MRLWLSFCETEAWASVENCGAHASGVPWAGHGAHNTASGRRGKSQNRSCSRRGQGRKIGAAAGGARAQNRSCGRRGQGQRCSCRMRAHMDENHRLRVTI